MAMTMHMTHAEIVRTIEALQADSFTNLLRQAAEMELQIEQDDIDPSQFIVREPGRSGFCELANAERCTCRRFRIWGRCAHHALVVDHLSGHAQPEGQEAA